MLMQHGEEDFTVAGEARIMDIGIAHSYRLYRCLRHITADLIMLRYRRRYIGAGGYHLTTGLHHTVTASYRAIMPSKK